jgi:quercetin dioxygenase-like cupin family protein
MPEEIDVDKVNLQRGFAAIDERWRPKVVGRLNGQEIKLVKLQGPFVWHRHDDADEAFLCWRGRFRLELRDRSIELEPGDLVIVARGVEHRPVAEEEAEVLLFEPAGTRNTGDVVDPRLTAP